MFGSVRRLAFNSDDMSISVSSWRKLFIALSLIALDLTYFFSLYNFLWNTQIYDTRQVIWYLTQYNGGWNGNVFFYGEFCRISDQWGCRSASQIWWENVMLGKKLFVHIKSKNSPNFSRLEICNKFILKSPTIAAYLFSLWSISIIGESSDTNCCIFTLLLLSWGGR